MWNQTFVLADRIKVTLLAWTGGLIIAATASDQFVYSQATTLPLSILGVFAQTYIVTEALRLGASAEAQSAIRPQFGRVFGISIVSTLAILLGGLLFIVPGVLLLIRWWIAVPVALDRDIGVSDALRESWRLTAPHWAGILGILLILLAMLAIPMAGLFFLGGLDQDAISIPASFSMNTAMYVVTSLGSVSTVAVYRTIYQPVSELRSVFE
jgi:hypothetical protein